MVIPELFTNKLLPYYHLTLYHLTLCISCGVVVCVAALNLSVPRSKTCRENRNIMPLPARDAVPFRTGGRQMSTAAASATESWRQPTTVHVMMMCRRSPWVGRNVATAVNEEIRQLSDNIRRALQCPVCMEMCGSISTCCRNGHSTCDECSHTMFRMLEPGASPKCPVCRSPAARPRTAMSTAQPPPPASVRIMMKLMAMTKVACVFRQNGCPEIVFVSQVAGHENHCPYVSQVRCMVAYCDWMGPYNCAFQHVSSDHQYSAYDVMENRFVMPDLTFGLKGSMRRMYLVRNVRQDNRLFWVGVARPSMDLVQVTVMKVMDPVISAQWTTEPPGIKFRLSTVNSMGWLQLRGKARPVCWDRTAIARSVKALERGADPSTCRAALYSPPWCILTITNDQQHEALITWDAE